MINLVPFDLKSTQDITLPGQSPEKMKMNNPSSSFFDVLQSVRNTRENNVDEKQVNDNERQDYHAGNDQKADQAHEGLASRPGEETNRNRNTRHTNENNAQEIDAENKKIKDNPDTKAAVKNREIDEKSNSNEDIDLKALVEQVKADLGKLQKNPDTANLKKSLEDMQALLSKLPNDMDGKKALQGELQKLLQQLESSGMKMEKGLLEELSGKLAKEFRELASTLDKAMKEAGSKKNLSESIERADAGKLLKDLADTVKKMVQAAGRENREPVKNAASMSEQKTAIDTTRTQAPGTTATTRHSDTTGNNADQNNQNSSFNMNNGNMRLFGQGIQKNAAGQGAPRGLFDRQLQQLMQQARITVQNNQNGSITMRMHPNSLGNLHVNLGLEQGVLNGRFLVESAEARQALMGQLESLRQELQEQGISVGDFQVNVRHGGQGSNQQDTESIPVIPGMPMNMAADDYETGTYQYVHQGSLDLII